MKLIKTAAAVLAAGVLALSVTGCSASSQNINELINARSSYTVSDFEASNSAVELIQQAAAAYSEYESSLVNTDKLADDLSDDDWDSRYIANKVAEAKSENLTARASFDKTVDSFNKRGISEVYAITADDIGADLNDEQAVANYVAKLLGGNAKVYVSDIVSVPALDDADGTYTGKTASYLRYVYIEYPSVVSYASR